MARPPGRGSTADVPLLIHGGNPILRWEADNVAVLSDPGGNLKPAKPDRHKSAKRIDGVAATVNALADYLASVDADWRKANGYTGRPVHRRAYWRNMAARILTDSARVLAEKPNPEADRPQVRSSGRSENSEK
jgi:hypothetical protein